MARIAGCKRGKIIRPEFFFGEDDERPEFIIKALLGIIVDLTPVETGGQRHLFEEEDYIITTKAVFRGLCENRWERDFRIVGWWLCNKRDKNYIVPKGAVKIVGF
jgi:hypothetical protein